MSNHIRSKSEFFSFYFLHDKQIMYYKQIYNTYKSSNLKATKRKTRQARPAKRTRRLQKREIPTKRGKPNSNRLRQMHAGEYEPNIEKEEEKALKENSRAKKETEREIQRLLVFGIVFLALFFLFF